MAKSKSKTKYVVLALVIVVVAAGAVYHKLGKNEPPISVSKEKAARRNITELVVANGKIESVLEVKISPEVSGEIIALPVKEGQHVKKGDLLLKIRPDNYVAARDSSKANFRFAVANKNTSDANLEKALLEFQRNDALFKAKLISESDYLTAKNAYDVAKTTLAASEEQVSIAQAQLDSAEADLSKTTIYSPVEGTLSKLNSQLGERVVGTATMAGTEIMIVSDLNIMEARVDIGEIDVPLISIGEKAHLEVDSFKDRSFNGIVTEIANSANNNDTDTTTATASAATSTDATKFQVKIRVTEKEKFLPGMSVTANIETRYRTNVTSVPIQSVTTRLPKIAAGPTNAVPPPSATSVTNQPPKPIEVVFMVVGDHVKMTPVTRGISDDNYVEIVSGLKDGDEVVSGGYKAINRDLEDGKKIVINATGGPLDKEKPN